MHIVKLTPIGLCFLLFTLAGCIDPQKSHVSKPNTMDHQASPAAKETAMFAVDELFDYFDTNPVRAKDWWKSEQIIITDAVKKISNSNGGGIQLMLVSKKSTPDRIRIVGILFDASFKERIYQINVGDMVTVRCRYTEHAEISDNDNLLFIGESI